MIFFLPRVFKQVDPSMELIGKVYCRQIRLLTRFF